MSNQIDLGKAVDLTNLLDKSDEAKELEIHIRAKMEEAAEVLEKHGVVVK